MVNIISLKELRPSLPRVIEGIDKKFDRYIITKHSKPVAVMMSIEDYEGLLETLEIESDEELVREIRESEKDMKAGKGVSLEKIEKDLGLV